MAILLDTQKEALTGLQSQVIAMDDEVFTKEHPGIAQQPHCNGHTRPFTKEEAEQVMQAIKSL